MSVATFQFDVWSPSTAATLEVTALCVFDAGLNVTGTLAVTGAATVSTTLGVTGITTATGGLHVDTMTANVATAITFASPVILPSGAGTTNPVPMQMTAGTNITTAVAGGMEYDGKCFYCSPIASNRGVNVIDHFIYQTGTFNQGTVNTAQPIFNAVTNGTITLPAATTYEFEMMFEVSAVGSGSRTLALLFPFSNAAQSINYKVYVNNLGATGYTTIAACQTLSAAVSTAVVITGTIAANSFNSVLVKGTFRTHATLAATLIPQLQWSTAPGTSSTIQVGSYFKCHAIGNASVNSVGAWS